MITYKQNGNNLVAEICMGMIYDVCEDIILYMSNHPYYPEYCDTEFNGIPLRIYATSDPRDVAMIYNLKNELRRAGK